MTAKKWWQSLNINQMDDYSFRFYDREFETLTPKEIQSIFEKIVSDS